MKLKDFKKIHFIGISSVFAMCVLAFVYVFLITEDIPQEEVLKDTKSEAVAPEETSAIDKIVEKTDVSGGDAQMEEQLIANKDNMIDAEHPPVGWVKTILYKEGVSYYQPTNPYSIYREFKLYFSDSTSTLMEYTQKLWNSNAQHAKPKVHGQALSAISETTINNRPAYQFKVAGSFGYEYGSWLLEGGEHLVTVLDFDANEKVIVMYPIYSESVQMTNAALKTLVLDKRLIPEYLQPESWTRLNGEGFYFEYPGNLFREGAETHTSNEVYIVGTTLGGEGSSIHLRKILSPLDPAHIKGLYGEIDDPDKIVIGGRTWYGYREGDAGWVSYIMLTSISDTETLKIMFGDSVESVYPLFDDAKLQQEIISTLVFE